MDTTAHPSLPCLSRISARLAADNRRVEQIIGKQMDVVERLFRATIAEDWVGVARATLQLASRSAEQVGIEVINEARNVYQELANFTGGFKRPKHLAGLLAACRELRMGRG